MIRRPPRSTRTDTLFPYTTLCRSPALGAAGRKEGGGAERNDPIPPAAVPVRADPEELHRRAIQHPVGIDAADDDDRRLSVRRQMALWLFAVQPALRARQFRRSHSRRYARPRRHRRLQLTRPRRGRVCEEGKTGWAAIRE